MAILALDPGKQMGYFYFENWSNYEIGTLEGKNYLEQSKNLENLVKNKQPQILVWETSFWWKTNKAQKDLQELVCLNGVIGYLAFIYGLQGKTILNHSVLEVAKTKTIEGLKSKENQWQFKGKEINIHERDAVLVFWIYWVRMLKKEWPFSS